MLGENIKRARERKGMTQQNLADTLNVVRQTVSKWEKGLSVPNSEMLIKISECLGVSVSDLLGEGVVSDDKTEIQALAEKLEILNEQFSRRNESRRRAWRCVFLCVGVLALLALGLCACSFVQFMISTKDIGIIGGADGPTAIFVARRVHQGGGIGFFVIVLAIAIVGLYKTRKR